MNHVRILSRGVDFSVETVDAFNGMCVGMLLAEILLELTVTDLPVASRGIHPFATSMPGPADISFSIYSYLISSFSIISQSEHISSG